MRNRNSFPFLLCIFFLSFFLLFVKDYGIEVWNRWKCVMRFLTFHIVIRLSKTFQWFDFTSIQYDNGIMWTGLLIVCSLNLLRSISIHFGCELKCFFDYFCFDCVRVTSISSWFLKGFKWKSTIFLLLRILAFSTLINWYGAFDTYTNSNKLHRPGIGWL